MDKQKVLAKLLLDLQSFLVVLDSENLSYIAQAQRKSISQLLSKLQDQESTAVEDAEYMIMSCPSSSPSNELIDTSGTESVLLSLWPRRESQGPGVPPLPPGDLGEDEDDEEEDDRDEDTYEEAEPFIPDTPITEKTDSDSSHYESYGGDDDDDDKDKEDEGRVEGEEPEHQEEEPAVTDSARYVQWSGSQPCILNSTTLRPAPSGDIVQWSGSQPCIRPAHSGESRLCGYLWRKRKLWLNWTKQLCIIRKHTLLCYKCAKDLHPQLELDLRGGRVAVRSGGRGRGKGREVEVELKVVVGSDSLTLGFSDQSHALEWRQAIEEVSGSTSYDVTDRTSSMFISDLPLSCRSSAVLLCEESSASICQNNKDKGLLNVLMNCQWQSLLCQVEAGLLKMFGEGEEPEEDTERSKERTPQYTLHLRGCEVRPGADTQTSYRITLLQHGDTVAVLEAGCQDDKDRWLQLLQDGAVNHHHHDDDNDTLETTGELSGLKTRRFPTNNNYMDDPFHLSGTLQPQPIYSNSSILEHMFQTNQDGVQADSVTYSNTVFSTHRVVQKLELAGGTRGAGQLRAGSEVNLASVGKQNKRTSFRQSLAFCSERAQAGFLNPLLRRTASAKTSLRRVPSSLLIDHGKVLSRKKEWEAKATA